MLITRYSVESERKRLEYLLEKWEGKLKIKRPSGSIVIVDGDATTMLGFLEELYSKIPKEHVEIYKLSEPEFHLEPLVLEGAVETSKKVNEVWSIVDFVMTRYHGILISEITNQRVYKVKTRKGECQVRFSIFEGDSLVVLEFSIEGYGEVVPYVYKRLLSDFSYLGRVVER